MAVERYIHGKKDNCKHDGRYANEKRLQQAIYDERDGLEVQESIEALRQRTTLPDAVVAHHEEVLRGWGLLPQANNYPLDTVGNKD